MINNLRQNPPRIIKALRGLLRSPFDPQLTLSASTQSAVRAEEEGRGIPAAIARDSRDTRQRM